MFNLNYSYIIIKIKNYCTLLKTFIVQNITHYKNFKLQQYLTYYARCKDSLHRVIVYILFGYYHNYTNKLLNMF